MPHVLIRASVVALLILAPRAALAAGGTHGGDTDASNGVAAVQPAAGAAPAPTSAKASSAEAPKGNDALRFCQNVAAAAAEARNAWQAKKLVDLQEQVTKTIADLRERETALKEVLARRDDSLKHAGATLVGIFAKMKPDTAAAQLSELDDETAAAVLQQLNPRAASAILDEIKPDRAVRLVNTIAGKAPDGKKS